MANKCGGSTIGAVSYGALGHVPPPLDVQKFIFFQFTLSSTKFDRCLPALYILGQQSCHPGDSCHPGNPPRTKSWRPHWVNVVGLTSIKDSLFSGVCLCRLPWFMYACIGVAIGLLLIAVLFLSVTTASARLMASRPFVSSGRLRCLRATSCVVRLRPYFSGPAKAVSPMLEICMPVSLLF